MLNWANRLVDQPHFFHLESQLRSATYLPNMQAVAANADQILCEVRIRLLALSMAILGLVLAPLGRIG